MTSTGQQYSLSARDTNQQLVDHYQEVILCHFGDDWQKHLVTGVSSPRTHLRATQSPEKTCYQLIHDETQTTGMRFISYDDPRRNEYRSMMGYTPCTFATLFDEFSHIDRTKTNLFLNHSLLINLSLSAFLKKDERQGVFLAQGLPRMDIIGRPSVIELVFAGDGSPLFRRPRD